VRFHPCVGATFDEVTDGNHEFVIRRNKALRDTQPCFTVPGLDTLEREFRTKDLFKPHPSIADLWSWQARADDIIVFLNGEKTNPISMEQHIMARNPELSGALVVGAQRFQAALLIEPAAEKYLTTAEQAALVERVWPSVEEANISAPAHARVEKSFILVVPSDRRLIRSGKGTFIRGASISQYTEEIEKLYSNDDAVSGASEVTGEEGVLYAPSLIEATRLIRQQVHSVAGFSRASDTENFFDNGMDSLQGLQLTRALRRIFRQQDIALSTVYQNPSVAQLANTILTHNSKSKDERGIMQDLLATYTRLVQQIPVAGVFDKRGHETPELVNVLLTGSTGAVGTQLLRTLLNRDGLGHIFCLNRGEDGGHTAQHASFASAGLENTELRGRVTFIRADLQNPSLGLDDATCELLHGQVGLVIHAAWPVNFNMSLNAFRPQLAALVNLITWTARTALAAKFVFVSSVAAVEGYDIGPPPEAVLRGLDTPAPLGYGRAKFLAELLVDEAARHLGSVMPACIIRVGQVAGPAKRRGLWNPKEWLPSLVMSSLHLGQVPGTLGPLFDSVDFVPIDLLADVMIDLAMVPIETMLRIRSDAVTTSATVFNLRNPHITPWTTLLPAIIYPPGGQYALQVVPPATWLANLRSSSERDDDDTIAKKNPAAKLLDFFSQFWPAEAGESEDQTVTRTQSMVIAGALACSPAMRNLEPVSLEWMRKWVEEWIDFQN
jgi:thioester reductase-like protein/aryl carrier-like protein